MNIEMIKNALSSIKPGTFTRVIYQTGLPLKAEYKKQGYEIIKTTSITTRFGIHYGNINGVEQKEDGDKRVNNFFWVDGFKKNLCFNTNTKKYYLCTYPTSKGTNIKASYCIKYPNGSFKGALKSITFEKNMVIDSYWKKSSTKMMRIDANNIIKIGK